MTASLIALMLAADSVGMPPKDTLQHQTADSIKADTLKEVTVHGNGLPVANALKKSLAGENAGPKVKSFGDVLELLSPGLNDKITHPFAFKQRKMERRHKRTRKILEHYDQVKTFDDLLREAIEREKLRQETQGKK